LDDKVKESQQVALSHDFDGSRQPVWDHAATFSSSSTKRSTVAIVQRCNRAGHGSTIVDAFRKLECTN
jgi:hypothetical protein